MLDHDLKRFADGLGETRAGLRLRLAMNETRIAVAQIKRLEQLGGQRTVLAIDSWRRAIIKANHAAAEAIDTLWNDHQWPEDGARERRFEWKPDPAFKR